MACWLRISSRDGRCGYALPIAVIDCDTNAIVSTHATHADALRAKVFLEQASAFARHLSPVELSKVGSSMSETMYATGDLGRLTTLTKFNECLRATQLALQGD